MKYVISAYCSVFLIRHQRIKKIFVKWKGKVLFPKILWSWWIIPLMLLLIRGHRDYETFVFILENITDANFRWADRNIYDNVYAHNMLLLIVSVCGRKTVFIFLMSADIFWYAYLIESLINYPIKEKNKTLRYVTVAWSMLVETFSCFLY